MPVTGKCAEHETQRVVGNPFGSEAGHVTGEWVLRQRIEADNLMVRAHPIIQRIGQRWRATRAPHGDGATGQGLCDPARSVMPRCTIQKCDKLASRSEPSCYSCLCITPMLVWNVAGKLSVYELSCFSFSHHHRPLNKVAHKSSR